MADESSIELNSNSTDHLASVAKVITGMVPVAGVLLSEIVGNKIPNQRVDRIARFLEELSKRLKEIEEETLRARLTSSEGVDLLEDAFFQAARTLTEERTEHLANLLAHGFTTDQLDYAQTKRLLWLLGQLSDEEIVILRSSLAKNAADDEADSDFREKNDELLRGRHLKEDTPPEEYDKEALISSYYQHLRDLQLIKSRSTPKQFHEFSKSEREELAIKPWEIRGPEITRLGEMLLDHLDMIPEWYQRT
ncbi:MAG: hypothetical protein CMJ46_11200 [Planctomyces sp.]|nr:hypothetical protein [Planctomyces sp.]